MSSSIDNQCIEVTHRSTNNDDLIEAYSDIQIALDEFQQSNFFKELDKEINQEPEHKDPLLFSFPTKPWLLQRLSRMYSHLTNPQNSRKQNSRPPSFKPYEVLFTDEISIYGNFKTSAEAMRFHRFNEVNNPHDFAVLVLWALKDTVPKAFEQLMHTALNVQHVENKRESYGVLPSNPYDADEPPFLFKEGNFLGKESIHPSDLINTFITGSTGAGKTFGGVIPLLQSFLRYQNKHQQKMSMLVVDPKNELLKVCQEGLAQSRESDRLYLLGKKQRLRFFESNCQDSLEERYRKLSGIVCVQTEGESKIWQEKGHRLNLNMLEQDHLFYMNTGWSLLSLTHSIISGVDQLHQSKWSSLLSIYKFAMQEPNELRWVHRIITILIGLFTDLEQIDSALVSYAQSNHEMMQQLFFRVNTAEDVCKKLSAPEITDFINTDLFPNDPNDSEVNSLFAQGKVIVLQPDSSYFGDYVGRLVKARFFSSIFMRTDMRIPIGYVADEFQRFITSDRETGEQSFLDRCRAYRVNCVLATQSIASLNHALTEAGNRASELSVKIIIANTPTKLVFRSSDVMTMEQLRLWIPSSAHEGVAHVVNKRPPSSLQTGFAYYLLNSEWGFYRYTKNANS